MTRGQHAIRLLEFDARQLHRLIDFANMKVESVDPLRAHFSLDLAQLSRSETRARIPIGRWKTTVDELKVLQGGMRDQLAQIVAEKQVGPQFAIEIDKWLQEVTNTDARAAGRGRITVSLNLDSPRAHCMYAMLLLRDTERLAKQVGRCRWCGRYFFDNEIRTGPRAKFCPGTGHRNSFYVYQNNHGKSRPQPKLP